MAMRRYLVFTGYCYYPGGGASDLEAHCDYLEECLTFLQSKEDFDWAEVLDTEEGDKYDFRDGKLVRDPDWRILEE